MYFRCLLFMALQIVSIPSVHDNFHFLYADGTVILRSANYSSTKHQWKFFSFFFLKSIYRVCKYSFVYVRYTHFVTLKALCIRCQYIGNISASFILLITLHWLQSTYYMILSIVFCFRYGNMINHNGCPMTLNQKQKKIIINVLWAEREGERERKDTLNKYVRMQTSPPKKEKEIDRLMDDEEEKNPPSILNTRRISYLLSNLLHKILPYLFCAWFILFDQLHLSRFRWMIFCFVLFVFSAFALATWPPWHSNMVGFMILCVKQMAACTGKEREHAWAHITPSTLTRNVNCAPFTKES